MVLADGLNPNTLIFLVLISLCLLFWILKSWYYFSNLGKTVLDKSDIGEFSLKRKADVPWQEDIHTLSKVNPKLNEYLDKLIIKSWSAKVRDGDLEFSCSVDYQFSELSVFLEGLLNHIRRVAPNLEIPRLVPRVRFERLNFCAGQFSIDGDGWVTISIDNKYLLEPQVSKAIMCHEICHYILEHNGIRYDRTLENEQFTESAMFVFGIGEIFLKGYRYLSNDGNDHQIGYLKSNEYDFLRSKALLLWETFYFDVNTKDDIEKKFKVIIPDLMARERLLEAEAKKNPDRSRIENIISIIDRHERDRR